MHGDMHGGECMGGMLGGPMCVRAMHGGGGGGAVHAWWWRGRCHACMGGMHGGSMCEGHALPLWACEVIMWVGRGDHVGVMRGADIHGGGM